MIKDTDTDNTIYPEDSNWANYTTNRHDGWADDVSLVYQKDSWKPDDEELTFVSIDDNDDENADEDTIEPGTKVGRKHITKFGIFMIFWSLVLSSTVCILLISHYDKLERFQNAYDLSQPKHPLDELEKLCQESNFDAIYGQITNIPDINEFENDISLKSSISKDILGKEILFEETDVNSSDEIIYTMKADSKIIAEINLRYSEAKTDEFGFGTWYISSLNYNFVEGYDVRIIAPVDAQIFVNNIPVSDVYCYSEDSTQKSYIISGFYDNVSIAAMDNNDNPKDIYYNEEDNIYSVK